MKCWALMVNRNRAKLYKRVIYTANLGVIKGIGIKGQFLIPDNSVPLEVERRLGSIPLWIVNEKTLVALTIKPRDPLQAGTLTVKEDGIKEYLQIIERTDTDAHTKLNLLIKREFWKQVALKIKLSLVETLIYLGAGYGLLRFIEYILIGIFGGG